MKRLYIDTNILIYCIEDSKNPFGKDISSSSSRIFWEAASCKYHLIISDWALEELRHLRKLEDMQMLFSITKKKIITCCHSQDDIKEAKERNPYHFQDELHGIIALRSGADCIVTRNISDFIHLQNIIKVVKPENLFKS